MADPALRSHNRRRGQGRDGMGLQKFAKQIIMWICFTNFLREMMNAAADESITMQPHMTHTSC
jgi:hypothetical protein